MALIVSDVKLNVEGDVAEFEISDGWYRIGASGDAALKRAIDSKRLQVGDKIIVSAATMSQHEACTPLDLPASVKLMVCGNSVKRARWHQKLGVMRCSPPVTCLNSALVDGGMVSAI